MFLLTKKFYRKSLFWFAIVFFQYSMLRRSMHQTWKFFFRRNFRIFSRFFFIFCSSFFYFFERRILKTDNFFFDFFIQNAFFHCFDYFFIFFANVLRSDDKQNDNIYTNIIHDDNFKIVFFIRKQFFYSFVFYVDRVDVFFCRCSKFKIELRND